MEFWTNEQAAEALQVSERTLYNLRQDSERAGLEPPIAARAFRLDPAYPIPFNPSTTLVAEMSGPATVSVRIYDLLGRVVRTIWVGPVPAGRVEWRWDGRDDEGRELPADVYFARVASGRQQETRRLVLVK